MTMKIEKHTDWHHSGTFVVDGMTYKFEGIDVNPYTEYKITSEVWYTIPHYVGRRTRCYTRLRSTYLYDDDDKLLKHMTERVRSALDDIVSQGFVVEEEE